MKNIQYTILPICLVLICCRLFSQSKSGMRSNPPLISTVTTSVDSVCPGEIVALTATSLGAGTTYLWSPGGATTSSISVSPPTTQIYTVYVTKGAAHDTSEFKVAIIPLPIPVISGTSFKCRGETDTLTVSCSHGPDTYIWSNGNTTTTYITGPIDADSTITVTAFNALGCSHDTTFMIVLRPPPCLSDINDIQYPVRFDIFPNPSNGIFTIESETEIDKASAEIYNVLGEKVYSQFSTFNSPLLINISNQPSGVYFYRILKQDGSLAGEGKLMIE